MHGKQSDASFDTESLLFKGCPKKAKVARYHSLAADADTMPDCLKITATTDDGEIMAVDAQGISDIRCAHLTGVNHDTGRKADAVQFYYDIIKGMCSM